MKYTVTSALTLQAGYDLGLSEAQATPRKHVLRAVTARKGWYTTTGPVQFKAGEEIACDGDLPKHLAQLLTPAAKPTPAPAAKD